MSSIQGDHHHPPAVVSVDTGVFRDRAVVNDDECIGRPTSTICDTDPRPTSTGTGVGTRLSTHANQHAIRATNITVNDRSRLQPPNDSLSHHIGQALAVAFADTGWPPDPSVSSATSANEIDRNSEITNTGTDHILPKHASAPIISITKRCRRLGAAIIPDYICDSSATNTTTTTMTTTNNDNRPLPTRTDSAEYNGGRTAVGTALPLNKTPDISALKHYRQKTCALANCSNLVPHDGRRKRCDLHLTTNKKKSSVQASDVHNASTGIHSNITIAAAAAVTHTQVLDDDEAVPAAAAAMDIQRLTQPPPEADDGIGKHGRCPHCPFVSRTFRGVAIHASICHGKEARAATVTAIPLRPPITVVEACTAEQKQKGWRAFCNILKQKWAPIWANWAVYWRDRDQFDGHMRLFLRDCRQLGLKLPGPMHPRMRYIKTKRDAKKAKKVLKSAVGYNSTTNPQRTAKNSAATRAVQHAYELAQWQFSNCRLSVAQSVLNPDQPKCKIAIPMVTTVYESVFGKTNGKCLNDWQYDIIGHEQQAHIDENYDSSFEAAEVLSVMKRMGLDKSAGPDGVLMRTIRAVDPDGEIHACIASAIQRIGFPAALCEARTVLIHKGGDTEIIGNWRPITIFPVTRRIVSKLAEHRLRRYVKFADAQMGFTSQPGCLKNISTLSRILQSEENCHGLLLDILKAFDTVGHTHIKRTLLSRPIPTVLRQMCCAALEGNTTRIFSAGGCTRSIKFLAGVPQGEPLSPVLFNMAIDFVIEALHNEDLRLKYGVSDDGIIRSVLSFADDTLLLGRDFAAIETLLSIAVDNFSSIGLCVNPKKTTWLRSTYDEDSNAPLVLQVNGESIAPAADYSPARYLGARFAPLQLFDGNTAMDTFKVKLERIISTKLLRADQKLQIFRQYLAPVLNYTFQVTPSSLIPIKWLKELDRVVISGIREVMQLPHSTCTAFFYATRAHRGMAITCYKDEARLQRLQALSLLDKDASASGRDSLRRMYDKEARVCFQHIQEVFPDINPLTQANLSTSLRARAFEKWSSMAVQGMGVALYKDVTISNRCLTKNGRLWPSDLPMAWQLTVNNTGVLTNKRISAANNKCRRCKQQPETIGHVLGSCPANNGFINTRHNDVVKKIATALRRAKYTVHVEVRCTGTVFHQSGRLPGATATNSIAIGDGNNNDLRANGEHSGAGNDTSGCGDRDKEVGWAGGEGDIYTACEDGGNVLARSILDGLGTDSGGEMVCDKNGGAVMQDAAGVGECVGGDGSTSEVSYARRVDIIAVNETRTKAFILDPTIRIERSEALVQDALDEKRRIYCPTIRYFQECTGVSNIELYGIWFGARGTIHNSTVKLFRTLKLPTALLEELSVDIFKHSIDIMSYHLKQ